MENLVNNPTSPSEFGGLGGGLSGKLESRPPRSYKGGSRPDQQKRRELALARQKEARKELQVSSALLHRNAWALALTIRWFHRQTFRSAALQGSQL
jgi:hypothetical protein